MQIFNTLAEATYQSSCTINGRPGTAEECAKAGSIALAIIIPILLIGLILFIFWVITLIHVIKHEDVPNRVVWIILHFIGAPLIASPIYFFAVKRPYDKKQHTGGPNNPPSTPPVSQPLPPNEAQQQPPAPSNDQQPPLQPPANQ